MHAVAPKTTYRLYINRAFIFTSCPIIVIIMCNSDGKYIMTKKVQQYLIANIHSMALLNQPIGGSSLIRGPQSELNKIVNHECVIVSNMPSSSNHFT